MRREYILVLIGIFSISTFSSFLSGYVQIEVDKVLLDTVVGIVGAGNFSYWQLGHSGPLHVELTSITGDADLYVSDSGRPSYEVDRNNFSSTTCGQDVVLIPMDFPRPISIGVFGHWTHTLSEYSIQVFLDPSALPSRETLHREAREAAQGKKPEADKRPREKSPTRKEEEKPSKFYVKLLEMLDMLFELIIL